MEFVIKIHDNVCWLLALNRDNDKDFYFKKTTCFGLYPWTNAKVKIEKIKAQWLKDYKLVKSYRK